MLKWTEKLKFKYQSSFFALALCHELEYRNVDGRDNTDDDSLALVRNLVTLGLANPDITTLDCVIWANQRNCRTDPV